MRNYAKTGGRKGKPGYRTPSSFRARAYIRMFKKYSGKKKMG